MILPDTSVWIELFRAGPEATADALLRNDLLHHPMVIGELAMGGLPQRRVTLAALARLNAPVLPQHEEVVTFVDANKLAGRGLSFIDAHLLASTILSKRRYRGVMLWTNDRHLHEAADELGIAFTPPERP